MPDLRPTVAIALLILHACFSAEATTSMCIGCAEVVTRGQEAHLCEDSRVVPYERVLGCRCAPSSPCEAACVVWCGSVDAAPEPGCAACSEAMCSADVAACEADAP